MKKIFVCLTALTVLVAGCSKTNEEAERNKLAGNTVDTTTRTCDTVNMKYSTDIQPILAANCYSCHANGAAQGGVTLQTYNPVKQRATNGILLNVITHASGFPAMPYQRPKLSDCDINKIRDWINRGALNN